MGTHRIDYRFDLFLIAIAAKALRDADQLRLDIVAVEYAKLRPYGAKEESPSRVLGHIYVGKDEVDQNMMALSVCLLKIG